MADVTQKEKIVPLITCEISLCQHVCELVFGVDILGLNLWIQIDSVKQPLKSNSAGSGYVSHCWTSAFDDHFDHCFVVLKNLEHRTELRRIRVRRNTINITQFKSVVLDWSLGLVLGVLVRWCVTQQVSLYSVFGFLSLVRGRMKHFNNQF